MMVPIRKPRGVNIKKVDIDDLVKDGQAGESKVIALLPGRGTKTLENFNLSEITEEWSYIKHAKPETDYLKGISDPRSHEGHFEVGTAIISGLSIKQFKKHTHEVS